MPQRKEQAECSGQGQEKSSLHSNTEFDVWQTHAHAHMPFQQLPTTLGMGRLDRHAPQKVEINTWTQKREWDTSIKGETNKDKRGGGWPQKSWARKAKLAHVVFPVGTTTRTIHLCPDHTFQAHSLQMILWEAFLLTSPVLSWSCYKLSPYNYYYYPK